MRDTYLGAKSRSRATLTYGQGHHQLARLPFPALVSDGAYAGVEEMRNSSPISRATDIENEIGAHRQCKDAHRDAVA